MLSCLIVVSSGGALINLGYPIPIVGQAIPSVAALANLNPFGVEILIPSFIIHWNPTPEVGWWDAVILLHSHPFQWKFSSSNRVICKVSQLRDENNQFSIIGHQTGNENILQSKITGIQAAPKTGRVYG
jgi:hypothetical protein